IFMLNHDHVCQFYGANYEGQYTSILSDYCTRGSLEDLFKQHDKWDDFFKNSLIFDIVKGMLYIHHSPLRSHGNLKPSNCLIDSRFMVKLTDFGLISQRLKMIKKGEISSPRSPCSKLWTAPEILKSVIPPPEGTQCGDVYSFAIIAHEILFQRGPFYRKEKKYTAEEIIDFVMSPPSGGPFRPSLEDNDDNIIDQQWRKTLRRCWAQRAKERPGFHELKHLQHSMQRETNLVDSLFQRLQQYSYSLEEKVEEKTEQYRAEKEKSDSLLYQMLPKMVAERLKMNFDVRPETYDNVTVYFSDIVGFSDICHRSEPLEVVRMLNELYTMFDQIIDSFDVYKIETIGDAYMVVSGLPERNGENHAREIARMALSLRGSVLNNFVIEHLPNERLKLRIGIHTGPVVAGVVGMKMPRYCLFGDTVNTAARMEQTGKELQIHLSPTTKNILMNFNTFTLKKRKSVVELKV
uniref:Guanylate cyclase n=1 Tax=Ciona savignyi TaxID=51511 RepID=H2YFF7_CIOSA